MGWVQPVWLIGNNKKTDNNIINIIVNLFFKILRSRISNNPKKNFKICN